MKRIHYKRKLKYLNALAEYFESIGYEVEEPKHDDDYVNVWGYTTVRGRTKRRKCYQQVHVFIYACDNGINGVIDDYDNEECYEAFLSDDPLYGLDDRFIGNVLGDLEPIKKMRGAK